MISHLLISIINIATAKYNALSIRQAQILEGAVADSFDRSEVNECSKRWHSWQAVAYLIICIAIGGVTIETLFLLLNRFVFFNPFINLFRKQNGFFHLGDKGLDGFFKKYLGKYAGQIVFFGSLAIIVIYLIINKN